MVNYNKIIAVELEKYPAKCSECPMFHTSKYQCHNESGIEGHCELGYMNDCDMRDFDGWRSFKSCNIKNDPRVRIAIDLSLYYIGDNLGMEDKYD